MSLSLILLIILILLIVGALPQGPAPWAANWGYGPSGLLGVLLIVVLILAVVGRI